MMVAEEPETFHGARRCGDFQPDKNEFTWKDYYSYERIIVLSECVIVFRVVKKAARRMQVRRRMTFGRTGRELGPMLASA